MLFSFQHRSIECSRPVTILFSKHLNIYVVITSLNRESHANQTTVTSREVADQNPNRIQCALQAFSRASNPVVKHTPYVILLNNRAKSRLTIQHTPKQRARDFVSQRPSLPNSSNFLIERKFRNGRLKWTNIWSSVYTTWVLQSAAGQKTNCVQCELQHSSNAVNPLPSRRIHIILGDNKAKMELHIH